MRDFMNHTFSIKKIFIDFRTKSRWDIQIVRIKECFEHLIPNKIKFKLNLSTY